MFLFVRSVRQAAQGPWFACPPVCDNLHIIYRIHRNAFTFLLEGFAFYSGSNSNAGAAFSYGSYRTWKSLIRAHLRLAKEMYDHQTKQEKKKSAVKKR